MSLGIELAGETGSPFWDPSIEGECTRAMRRHPSLTHRSLCLTLLARCGWLKRHGVGERESDLGADFGSAKKCAYWSFACVSRFTTQQRGSTFELLKGQTIRLSISTLTKAHYSDSQPLFLQFSV